MERAKSFVSAGLASGVLKPAIDRVFTGLGEYADAHYHMSTNTQAGKIIVAL
jgi:NADPH2:quinone reductase